MGNFSWLMLYARRVYICISGNLYSPCLDPHNEAKGEGKNSPLSWVHDFWLPDVSI